MKYSNTYINYWDDTPDPFTIYYHHNRYLYINNYVRKEIYNRLITIIKEDRINKNHNMSIIIYI